MALNIENTSGAPLDINDLGITLAIGQIVDLSLVENPFVIANSANGGDLDALITAPSISVKDPIDGTTALSVADGLAACRAHNETHWRVGSGARIGDVSDVTLTTPATDQVLQYNGSDWVNVDPATVGAGASIQLEWKFSTTTTAADPGSTRFRYNNATLASVTEIYVSDIALSGVDASTILNQLTAGDKLYIQQKDTAASAALFTVVSITDNVGWFTIDVTVDDSGVLHQNNRDCGWVLLFSSTFSGVNQDQIIYVGKHGNDANDGKTIEKAVLTFGQAITLAAAESPADEDEWAVVCFDAGFYNENISITTPFILVHAANAHLEGTVTVADNVAFVFEHIHLLGAGDAITMTTAVGDTSYVSLKYLHTEGGANGIVNNSSGILNVEVEFYRQTGGTGIENSSITHADIQDWDLDGTSPTAVQTTGGTTNVRSANMADRGATTSLGFDCDGGTTNVMVANAEFDTLSDVEVGAELNITAGSVTGTELNNGTSNILESSHELNETHLPVGGTAGQVLEKIDGTDYNVQWASGTTTDLASVVASRAIGDGTQAINNGSFGTINFPTTEFENDAAIVSHDPVTNNSRITFTEAGTYQVHYSMTMDPPVATTVFDTRVIANGVATALPGSERMMEEDEEQNDCSNVFYYTAAANDYIELQVQANQAAAVVAETSNFGAQRARGAKGDTGPAGAGSTIVVEDEGITVTGGPHDTLNFVGSAVTATDAGGGTATITITGGGGGDVSAAVNLVDNSIVRGDGGVKGVQDSNDGATVDWTIADSGQMVGEVNVTEVGPPFTSAHFGMYLHNQAISGGGGLLIEAGEDEGDIAFRICDEDNTLNILDVHADDGQLVLGDTYDDVLTANSIVYGIDNQHPVQVSGVNDFNTANGVYRVAGTPVTVGEEVIQRFTFDARRMENPTNADWAVNALAPATPDSNNAGVIVRRFDDTTDEGVGFSVRIPPAATDMTIYFVSRAETAPGGAVTAALDLYRRDFPDNAAPSAWSAALALTAIDLPTNENWQYDEQTITLATLGLTAGEEVQFELVRNGGTLSGDWTLKSIALTFSGES